MPNPFAPDRSTLVAPMLPLPWARISCLRTSHTSRNPKGMEPSRYATITTIGYRGMGGLSVAAAVLRIGVPRSSGKLGFDVQQIHCAVCGSGSHRTYGHIAGPGRQPIGD